jgi:hypothetical protein
MKKSLYIFIAFLFGSFYAKAQQRYFIMDSPIKNIVINGTTTKDTSLSFTYTVMYHGTSSSDTFHGYITTCYFTRSDSTIRWYSDSPRIYSIPHNKIATIKVVINDLSTRTFNNGGNNIVVAWPTGTVADNKAGVYCKDSTKNLIGRIVLKGLDDIKESSTDFDPVSVYPNPAGQTLQVALKNESIKIRSLTIFDLKGQKVYSSDSNLNSIDIGGLHTGIYILQVQSGDNRIAKYKFMKQ